MQVWRSYKKGAIMDVIDKVIIDSSNEQVSTCIQVGLLCTQANPSLRPPMTNVNAMLSNLSRNNLPNPTKPAYVCIFQDNALLPTSTSKSTSLSTSSASQLVYPSINDATITYLSSR